MFFFLQNQGQIQTWRDLNLVEAIEESVGVDKQNTCSNFVMDLVKIIPKAVIGQPMQKL